MVTVQPFHKMVLTAKTPQYYLPDLRGRQRAQRLFFLFSVERGGKQKEASLG